MQTFLAKKHKYIFQTPDVYLPITSQTRLPINDLNGYLKSQWKTHRMSSNRTPKLPYVIAKRWTYTPTT